MKKRILVAEDERIIAMDIRRILEKEDYEITYVAASALDVIEKAEIYRPDVILMDIMLEGELDGVEAAKIISYKHNIPVIFITALKDESIIQKANLPNFFTHIIKPFEDHQLIQTLNTLFKKQLINNL